MSGKSSTPGRFTIRRALKEDAAMLKELASRTFYDTFKGTAAEEDFVVAMEDWFNVPRFEARIADAVVEVYVAEDAEGEPAGYMILRNHRPEFPTNISAEEAGLELQNLYLDTPAHGTGLAQEFMQLYFERAEALGVCFLWLGVWENNHRAQRFYTKHGFAPTGHGHPFPIHNTPQTDEWWSREIARPNS